MQSAHRDNFTSFFTIQMPFISFCYLIYLARTSNTTMNRSGKCGYPCFVPDLREKYFNFSQLNLILSMGLSHMAFIVLKYILIIPNSFESFVMKVC